MYGFAIWRTTGGSQQRQIRTSAQARRTLCLTNLRSLVTWENHSDQLPCPTSRPDESSQVHLSTPIIRSSSSSPSAIAAKKSGRSAYIQYLRNALSISSRPSPTTRPTCSLEVPQWLAEMRRQRQPRRCEILDSNCLLQQSEQLPELACAPTPSARALGPLVRKHSPLSETSASVAGRSSSGGISMSGGSGSASS